VRLISVHRTATMSGLCPYTARYTKNYADAVHNPDHTRRLLLRTFVAQLVAATKICLQPRQNAAAVRKRANKHGFQHSSDTR